MFPRHVVTPNAFAVRFVELLPVYLPGLDTGAFEPTDRRRCWNKTLKAILTVIGRDDNCLDVDAQNPMMTPLKDQSSLFWLRDGAPLFLMATGWGDRNELERSLVCLEALKCPQKLFVYSCSKWQEAVLDQIRAALLRYPYHLEGEQYLFMNMLGAENRYYLFSADMDQNGRQTCRHEDILKTVPGSPFRWNTKRQSA
jgi:hypothetical protein